MCNWTPPLRNLEEGSTPDRNAVAELAKVCYFEVIHLVLRSLKIMKCRPGPVKKNGPLGLRFVMEPLGVAKVTLVDARITMGPLG